MKHCLMWPFAFLLTSFTGNGFIEEKELESFFRELEMAWRGEDMVSLGTSKNSYRRCSPGFHHDLFFEDPSNPMLKEKVKEFVQKFDKNKDGRIEMSEVRAAIVCRTAQMSGELLVSRYEKMPLC